MAKVKITETVLRDSHQSLIATRMTTDEILPILAEMDKVGYHSVEAWGGATFDACMRFLNEDPWERLRKIKAEMKNTKIQMLFRGQNILGYRHYADDVVEYFVQKSIANGVDIIRIFDALNDARNLRTAINATKKEGGHVQAAMSYTISPVHNNEYFAKYAKELEEMGADSICIKDMSGLLKPYAAKKLSINRIGDYVDEEIRHSFLESDRQLDYGVRAAAGFALVFDPVELHITAKVRYSFQTLYDPDYLSPYYYRYAYPLDVMVTAGLHFQITKKTGKTKPMLRKEAYNSVFGENAEL